MCISVSAVNYNLELDWYHLWPLEARDSFKYAAKFVDNRELTFVDSNRE